MDNFTTLQPTLDELAVLFPPFTLKHLNVVLRSLGEPEPPRQNPRPRHVLALAVYVWLNRHLGANIETKLDLLYQRKTSLERIVDAFDEATLNGLPLPPATLTLADNQFFICRYANYDQNLIIDIKTGQAITQLPAAAETLVVCDLNVLMLRLIDRIKRLRQQEPNAPAQGKPPPGPDQP